MANQTLLMRMHEIVEALFMFRNPFVYLRDLQSKLSGNVYRLVLNNGVVLNLRTKHLGMVGDVDIVQEVYVRNIYDIEHFVKSTDTVVDIGAHIGVFSLLAARIARKGRIIAIEPVAANYQLLQANITENSFKNVLGVNAAIGNVNEPRYIYIDAENSGGHSQFGKGKSSAGECTITKTLVEIMDENNLETIDVLKIDCEGGEYEILLNLPPTYFARITNILMEQHITTATEAVYEREVLKQLLTKYGFKTDVVKEIYYEDEGLFWIIFASK